MGQKQLNQNSLLPRAPKPGHKAWLWGAWLWSAFIVLICLTPHNPGPPTDLPLDKLAHFLLFAAFGGLWLRAYPRKLLEIAIAGTALGLAIELLQSALNWGRMGEGADFAADCIGLLFSLAMGVGLDYASRRSQVKQH